MDFELGTYEIYGKHSCCEYGGVVMRIRPLKIDGQKHPSNAPDEWYWCNGKSWDGKERVWTRCKASSLDGTL